MNKKSLVVILILSTIITYGLALIDFSLSISKGAIGLPFGFSRFNFFGAETEKTMLLLDIAFWFLVIWGAWKLFPKLLKKR
ncbi:MAG: hypothetical protein A3H17_04245 [Candidatus Levybacteria bacterium RIFCSPLOWO2_12_FULL_37_14]|nr:MAG: hypothetical protein US43_C0033G0005 [Candidatus Levybacteria bacterium GW2011_GWA1_37_16]OGH50455.1 MAG: hypothetical protein A3H17_04245 [Candidatus Levybacteria bacterium RIFCSPLOWO2_12_FULL_37_14]